MRHSWLILGLVISLSACSNASFRGLKGSSSKDNSESPNTADAVPQVPVSTDPTPSAPGPGTENPNTNADPNNPMTPCLPVGLDETAILNNQLCPNPNTNTPDNPGNDPKSDNDAKNSGNTQSDDKKNPGQN